jgi:hypothetical protein
MKLPNVVKYSLLLGLVTVFALTGVTWASGDDDDSKTFGLNSLKGRYISAEDAYDVSSVHAAAAPNASLVGPPVFFAGATVMVADGKGNVCGESDGFYGGTPPPGVNLGPNLFHGTYTVEAGTGRVTIITAGDGAPSLTNVFCGTTTPIITTGVTVFKTQVGYLQGHHADKVATVEQINASDSSKGGCCATSGFLVHHRNWTRAGRDDRRDDD